MIQEADVGVGISGVEGMQVLLYYWISLPYFVLLKPFF
jgi:hypothetical protein